MYAIVKSGGKQYRVERGQRLLVERLPVEEGADVALEPILYRSEEAIFDKEGLANVKVTAKVLAHVRGEKLRVFKFKPKRGYKRRTGHRQELTSIEVTEIATGRRKAAKAAGEGEKAPGGAAKPAAGGAKPAGGAAKRAAKPAGAAAKSRGEGATKAKAGGGATKAKAGEAAGKAKAGEAAKPARTPKTPRSTGTKAKKETTDDGS
jgi:large subunit ribosomal protein L21